MRYIPIQGSGLPSPLNKKTQSSGNNSDVANKFQQALKNATVQQQPSSPSANHYTIRQGDTLSEIVAAESKKSGTHLNKNELYTMVNRVARDNKLNNPDRIFAGNRLDLSSLTQASPSSTTTKDNGAMVATTSPRVTPSSLKLQAPVNGTITSAFGMRQHPTLGYSRHHDGIDISQPTGTPVAPLDSGTVTFAGKSGDYGLMVEIDHGNGFSSRYAHLDKVMVNRGDAITTSETLGQVGATGLATGSHLHLEVHHHDTPIDPLSVIARSQIETGLIVADVGLSALR